jgi:hypothetical protein
MQPQAYVTDRPVSVACGASGYGVGVGWHGHLVNDPATLDDPLGAHQHQVGTAKHRPRRRIQDHVTWDASGRQRRRKPVPVTAYAHRESQGHSRRALCEPLATHTLSACPPMCVIVCRYVHDHSPRPQRKRQHGALSVTRTPRLATPTLGRTPTRTHTLCLYHCVCVRVDVCAYGCMWTHPDRVGRASVTSTVNRLLRSAASSSSRNNGRDIEWTNTTWGERPHPPPPPPHTHTQTQTTQLTVPLPSCMLPCAARANLLIRRDTHTESKYYSPFLSIYLCV